MTGIEGFDLMFALSACRCKTEWDKSASVALYGSIGPLGMSVVKSILSVAGFLRDNGDETAELTPIGNKLLCDASDAVLNKFSNPVATWIATEVLKGE